jgi:carbon monoxide dehydrogenase subunit G
MIHFERTLEIEATTEAIWAVASNFMHIDEFAPEIKSVDALTEGKVGIGSKRRNHFNNGTSLVEEVIEWDTDSRYHRISSSEMSSMPLHEAYSAISIERMDSGRSMVTWDFDYRVKFGPLGWLLGQTMMKMMMGKIIDANLKGLAEKVEANEPTTTKAH